MEEKSTNGRVEKYCYNKSLIDRVFSSTRWYYVLSMGVVINFAIIVILVIYIVRWRRGRYD